LLNDAPFCDANLPFERSRLNGIEFIDENGGGPGYGYGSGN
jgi:hypothetical protein